MGDTRPTCHLAKSFGPGLWQAVAKTASPEAPQTTDQALVPSLTDMIESLCLDWGKEHAGDAERTFSSEDVFLGTERARW